MRAPDRVITPEILDSLDHQDPRAVSSRRDLLLIDSILGNSRWVTRTLAKFPNSSRGIVELGAGEGTLCNKISQSLPGSSVTGLDLIPRPETLRDGIHWMTGDFFDTLEDVRGSACVGSLIIHHFSTNVLGQLGRRLQKFDLLVFAEPLRSRLSLSAAALSTPFIGKVTRHDMPASIRAGFQPGEIAEALHLDANLWTIEETATWFGTIRFLAHKSRC